MEESRGAGQPDESRRRPEGLPAEDSNDGAEREGATAEVPTVAATVKHADAKHRSPIQTDVYVIPPLHVRFLAALAGIATQVGCIMVGALSANWFGSGNYVWPVMILAPAAGSFVHAFILFKHGMSGIMSAFWQVAFANAVVLAGLIITGAEGWVCVAMCLPLLAPLWMLGTVGSRIAANKKAATRAWMIGVIAVVPSGSVIPVALLSAPAERDIVTVIDIDAPSEVVWGIITSPIDLPPDGEGLPWTLKLGYPRPVRCEIDGRGVGATRRCIFDQGSFDERVTVWEEGRELSFSIESQPAKIAHFLHCSKGQILLEAKPDGGTLVTRTTWYSLDMDPSFYFGILTDKLIYDIHVGSFGHIKKLAEGE